VYFKFKFRNVKKKKKKEGHLQSMSVSRGKFATVSQKLMF